MKIILNKKQIELDQTQILASELLKKKGFTFPMIILKVNGVLVKKERRQDFTIKDGDTVDAFHLVSGG
jgi:sulfur carrier protein